MDLKSDQVRKVHGSGVLDCRHGRVPLRPYVSALDVCDPVTYEQREVPLLPLYPNKFSERLVHLRPPTSTAMADPSSSSSWAQITSTTCSSTPTRGRPQHGDAQAQARRR